MAINNVVAETFKVPEANVIAALRAVIKSDGGENIAQMSNVNQIRAAIGVSTEGSTDKQSRPMTVHLFVPGSVLEIEAAEAFTTGSSAVEVTLNASGQAEVAGSGEVVVALANNPASAGGRLEIFIIPPYTKS